MSIYKVWNHHNYIPLYCAVLSKVSASNGTGRSLHEQASAIHRDTSALKKALRNQARAKRKTFVESKSVASQYRVYDLVCIVNQYNVFCNIRQSF